MDCKEERQKYIYDNKRQGLIKSQTKNKSEGSIQPKGDSLKRTTKWKV